MAHKPNYDPLALVNLEPLVLVSAVYESCQDAREAFIEDLFQAGYKGLYMDTLMDPTDLDSPNTVKRLLREVNSGTKCVVEIRNPIMYTHLNMLIMLSSDNARLIRRISGVDLSETISPNNLVLITFSEDTLAHRVDATSVGIQDPELEKLHFRLHQDCVRISGYLSVQDDIVRSRS